MRNRRAEIKVYTMVPEGAPTMGVDQYAGPSNHVMKELANGNLDARLGLGFLVISDGIANVGLWGGEFPSLLNQAVFAFDSSVKPLDRTYTRKSLDESGTFCCWEMGIAGHEAASWRYYLLSKKSPTDRNNYLKDQFRGIVG